MPANRIVSPTETYAGLGIESMNADDLAAQLIPLRDALLKVFDRIPSRARGEVRQLEIGLALTSRGHLATPGENMRQVLTMTLCSRERPPRSRSGASKTDAAKPDILVAVDEVSPTSRSVD
jgi:hypothetical protein